MAGKVKFTSGRVADFKCPPERAQAFLWDSKTNGLGLRITPSGKPSYIFQGRYQGKTLRMTIGSPDEWLILDAQAKAREYQRMIDEGRDPREVVAAQSAEDAAARKARIEQVVTLGEAWSDYLQKRRVAKAWSEQTYRDHLAVSQLGGKPRKRLPGTKTKPGPLAALMPLKLADVSTKTVESWAAKEFKKRPTRVRLAIRLLKAFLRWADTQDEYSGNVQPDAASSRALRGLVGTSKPKQDVLQREQLPVWFQHVRLIQNPVISVYLQCLLLTGARREELAMLKWTDVNFRWKGMTIKDKVNDERTVPLTPFVASLLSQMPRRNKWVFSSPTSASGRLMEPSIAHRQACAAAGLELTLHGLRRSFASLCEWLDIPGGISAQIQGHAPQGVREQNYIRRPLDLLRVHHEKIEAWILEQAGIAFNASENEKGGLRMVSND